MTAAATSAADFAAFVARCEARDPSMSRGEIAAAIGKDRARIAVYMRDGLGSQARTILLACAAVDAGLEPFMAPAASTSADA